MKTLYRQLGSTTTGLATASAIFVGLLLYAHYYAFDSSREIDSEQPLASVNVDKSVSSSAITGIKQGVSASEESRSGLQANKDNSSSGAIPPSIDQGRKRSETESPASLGEIHADAGKAQSLLKPSHQNANATTTIGSYMAVGNVPMIPNGPGSRPNYGDDVMALRHHNRLGGYSTNRADHRVNYQSKGQGNGRSRGQGDGEFTFDMSFKSRSRMHADMDADADLHADQVSYQTVGVYQTQGMHPAYRYYYYGY